MLPLFIDVFSAGYDLRLPSSDVRCATGLLFGERLSSCLYPAFMIVMRKKSDCAAQVNPLNTNTALPLILLITSFFLNGWDIILAFGALESIGIIGFSSLFGILVAGLFKIISDALSRKAS